MASTTGELYPSAANGVDRSGNYNWTLPGNATANDGSDATVTTPSDYLVCSNFGASIPSGVTILGVIVRVEIGETGSGSSEYNIQLSSNASPTLIGTAKGPVAVSGSTKVVSTNGNSSDLWGATLTHTIINDAGFSIVIWSDDGGNDLQIDYVTLEVWYELSGLTGSGDDGDAFFLLLIED